MPHSQPTPLPRPCKGCAFDVAILHVNASRTVTAHLARTAYAVQVRNRADGSRLFVSLPPTAGLNPCRLHGTVARVAGRYFPDAPDGPREAVVAVRKPRDARDWGGHATRREQRAALARERNRAPEPSVRFVSPDDRHVYTGRSTFTLRGHAPAADTRRTRGLGTMADRMRNRE